MFLILNMHELKKFRRTKHVLATLIKIYEKIIGEFLKYECQIGN